MFDEEAVLQKMKWLDMAFAIAMALGVTVFGAWALRQYELRTNVAAAQPIHEYADGTALSLRLYDGYLRRDGASSSYGPLHQIPETRESSWIHRLLGISTAYAAEVPSYSAELVNQNYTFVRGQPGRAFTAVAEFMNTGTASWTNSGEHFLALNVSEPAGRTSAFRHPFWSEYAYRPTRLQQSIVRPGEIGRFVFALQVPTEPGRYVEHFGLVAENLTWLPGGDVHLTIVVPRPYEARLVQAMAGSVTMNPGQEITFWADFKNVGSATWTKNGDHFLALNVAEPAGRESVFRHPFWNEQYYRAARLLQDSVKPGEIGRFRFALKAPNETGFRIESFGLVAENLTWLPGGVLRLPIQVGQVESLGQAEGEPLIRVGITSELNPIEVRANGRLRIKKSTGALLASLNTGSVASVRYENNRYRLTANGKQYSSVEPIRFIPDSASTILEAKNYEHRPGWNPDLNDNTFRGLLEVNFATATNRLWLINELPLEAYLRGIAETSNASPKEFQRTLIIAARSYAYYHIQRNTKHADEHFTVDATYDQVYRGYGFESRAQKITEAVLATKGKVVALNGTPVITPYYSNSDGRTRSWEEVWAGDPKPWLVSVPDPWCAGMELNGHGVGLSAVGAIGQANEGKSASEILSYYYQGTALKQLY